MKRLSSISAVISLVVGLTGCQAFAEDEPRGTLSPEHQYELAIERRADLSEFQRELVEALGASDWGPAGEPDHATASRCREDDREHFAFKRRQRTADDLQPFIRQGERDAVLERLKVFAEARGMAVEVELRAEDTYVYADGRDFHVLLMVSRVGKANLIVETSCSDEWPDFDLTVQEFMSLESRRRFPTETRLLRTHDWKRSNPDVHPNMTINTPLRFVVRMARRDVVTTSA